MITSELCLKGTKASQVLVRLFELKGKSTYLGHRKVIFDFLSGVPVAERFSFCLNTLLCDVAARCHSLREEIILGQIDLLTALINFIRSCKEQNGTALRGTNLRGLFYTGSGRVRYSLLRALKVLIHAIPRNRIRK